MPAPGLRHGDHHTSCCRCWLLLGLRWLDPRGPTIRCHRRRDVRGIRGAPPVRQGGAHGRGGWPGRPAWIALPGTVAVLGLPLPAAARVPSKSPPVAWPFSCPPAVPCASPPSPPGGSVREEGVRGADCCTRSAPRR